MIERLRNPARALAAFHSVMKPMTALSTITTRIAPASRHLAERERDCGGSKQQPYDQASELVCDEHQRRSLPRLRQSIRAVPGQARRGLRIVQPARDIGLQLLRGIFGRLCVPDGHEWTSAAVSSKAQVSRAICASSREARTRTSQRDAES